MLSRMASTASGMNTSFCYCAVVMVRSNSFDDVCSAATIMLFERSQSSSCSSNSGAGRTCWLTTTTGVAI